MDNQPLFSKCVSSGTRVYYIDARKDAKGQPYISISEIPRDNVKERQRIFIHAETLPLFGQAFEEVADYITGRYDAVGLLSRITANSDTDT